MIRTTPLRRTILHLLQIFFTDALTFMLSSLLDAPFGESVAMRHQNHFLVVLAYLDR
jgi:hypothetical protein